MPELVWDEVGSRSYETGLDKGVLYLPEGGAVPWNGLVDVVEKHDGESTPVYFNGSKISDLVSTGSFLGTIKAITFPDEFTELEGMSAVTDGLFLGHQRPKVFALCWRTLIGNDLDEAAGYKLHILYNVTAVPSDKTYSTVTEDPNIAIFEWGITAIPEIVSGFKPTAYIVLDSRAINPAQLAEYEDILYGTASSAPALIPLIDFVNGLYYGFKWKVFDNGDGTWSAYTPIEGLIEIDPVDEDLFTLSEINATYLSEDLYQISDTLA